MTLAEIGKVIDKTINEKYGSQKEFARQTNRNYIVLNSLINKLLSNKNVTYNRLVPILDDLNLELEIKLK